METIQSKHANIFSKMNENDLNIKRRHLHDNNLF